MPSKLHQIPFDQWSPAADVGTPGSAIEERYLGQEVESDNLPDNNNVTRRLKFVKNKTGAAITAKRVVCYSTAATGYEGKVVGKTCDAIAERAAGVVAPDYPADVSIPQNALFWIVIYGPATCIIGDINSTITRGQPVVTDNDADGGKVGLASGGTDVINQLGHANEAAAGTDTEIDVFVTHP